MRSYLRTLCALALMLGTVGMGRAMAATTDNLQMEVHVTIAGTHDVIWAAGSTGAISGGTNENVAGPPNNNVDSVASGSNSTGASDRISWTIVNPLLGEVRLASTETVPITFLLDNVGNKKVNVTATIPDAATADSTAVAADRWTIGNAPGVSTFRLRISSADSGLNNATDATNPGAAIGAQGLSALTDLGPLVAGPPAGPVVTLVTDWKRFQNHIAVDLEYSTPTDVTNNSEFDVDHITTITIATTAP